MRGAKAIVYGEIDSGKSTVVRTVMAQLGWGEPAGFFTHWGGGGRSAPEIFIEPWTGGAQRMAHRIPEPAGPDRLPYALDVEPFTQTALASLSPPGRPVVVDELGVIELGATEFSAAIADVFRGPAPVLAVIQQRALARWLSLIDPRNAEHLFHVTPDTRDALPAAIAQMFRS